MSARDLFGAIARHHGCKCQGCRTTARYIDTGFNAWPKDGPATPREAKTLYTAHVSFNWKDARKRADLGPTGAGFYGLPKGMSAQKVALVLDASFRETP